VSEPDFLPRLLVIDDLFGRVLPDRRNEERANLCGQYLLEDVTGDEAGKGAVQKIRRPIARVIFHRGQRPSCARVGDSVENDLEGALAVVRRGWERGRGEPPLWAMVLLDLCFLTGRVTEDSDRGTPGMPEGREEDRQPRRYFGLRLLDAIQSEMPELPVIVLSSHPREEVSREFSHRGALGFLARAAEDSPERLRDYLWRNGLLPDELGEIVGRSRALLLALRTARRLAAGRDNILLRGERGTGKELFAQAIWRHSSRAAGPFLAINCAAIPETLLESELFGHEKGAFTGADRKRIGKFEQCNGGTLLLDEIGDMPLGLQAKILRLLQEQAFERVGGTEIIQTDVRLIAATNQDLEARAAAGAFRFDLLDRLRLGGTVYLPPLRERLEDLPLLVEKLVRDAEAATPGAMRRDVDPRTLDRLGDHDWPGNVRELAGCLHQAVKDYPDVEHLVPGHVRLPGRPAPAAPAEGPPAQAAAARPGFADLDSLLRAVEEFPFEKPRAEELSGKLPGLLAAFACLLARFLRAAFDATARTRTGAGGAVQRDVLLHPAMKLVTGDPRLTASRAADLVKRYLGLSAPDIAELLEDPLLKEALGKALALRPRQPRGRGGASAPPKKGRKRGE
jgi:two-component system nitrogen regulation response regulator GlnG